MYVFVSTRKHTVTVSYITTFNNCFKKINLHKGDIFFAKSPIFMHDINYYKRIMYECALLPIRENIKKKSG
jgi:hypothetical protein